MRREELALTLTELDEYTVTLDLPDPVKWGRAKAWVAVDTETTGLEWAEDGSTFLMATLYAETPRLGVEGRGEWYGVAGSDSREDVVDWLVRFCHAGGTLVLQNNKFDFHQLGLDPSRLPERAAPATPAVVDTAILMHLIDSREYKRLENLEQYFLGTDTKARLAAQARGSAKGRAKDFHKWGAAAGLRYALNDARVTLLVAKKAWAKAGVFKLHGLYRKEERYLRLLWRAERRGVRLDVGRVKEALTVLYKQQEVLENTLYEKVGRKFLWTSSKQLSQVLYEEYRDENGKQYPKPKNPYADADGVDRSKFADRGKYNSASTSSFLLMEKAGHPLGEYILALRETTKLQRVLEKWIELAHESEGEHTIHTNYNMTGTRTGRLSSSRPQVQNVPSDVRVHETQSVYSGDAFHRTEAYNLRRCFVARPGYVFVSLDHKQQEGRLFGIISEDPVMKQALEAKLDIHKVVAKLVWGNDDDLHREWAKTISFGMIYGMTTGSLEHRLNKTRKEAEQIAKDYQGRFPRLMPFLKECIEQVKLYRYVRYWSGRIWREDDMAHAYKSANAMVQGGAADLISIAAMRCQKWLDEAGIDGHLLLIVHDELIFELPEWVLEPVRGEVGEDGVVVGGRRPVLEKLIELMEVPDLLGMPFLADVKVGPDFGTLKKIT
jgi:DNA polymerase-1